MAACDDAGMRVLIAPDCFAGTLTAGEAAEAIAAGWRRARRTTSWTSRPLSDGGPGFVDVLGDALGGRPCCRSTARRPLGTGRAGPR